MALLVVALGICLSVLFARIYCSGLYDDRAPADAIVVLGAAQYDGHPSPVFRARLDHAITLYRKRYGQYLLITGGCRPGDRYTEAVTGRSYALAQGIPFARILLENHGRTTWQSLQAVPEILQRHHLRSVILVSDPFHAFRLRRMAHDLRLQATVSPTPQSRIHSGSMQFHFILREAAVYALYRIFRV